MLAAAALKVTVPLTIISFIIGIDPLRFFSVYRNFLRRARAVLVDIKFIFVGMYRHAEMGYGFFTNL